MKHGEVIYTTDGSWVKTVLLRTWPSKNGPLLLLRTPVTYTVVAPDGEGWIFGNEEDAVKYYEAKVKEVK